MTKVKKLLVITKVKAFILNAEGVPEETLLCLSGKFSTEKGIRKNYKGDSKIVYIDTNTIANEKVLYEMDVDTFLEHACIAGKDDVDMEADKEEKDTKKKGGKK